MNEQLSAAALLNDPMAIFAYLAGLMGLLYWLSGLKRLQKFFDIVPTILFVYFLPTLSTAFGITPAASPAYDWMTRYLLPLALFLLMLTVDLPAIGRLGGLALLMMLAGTLGTAVGAPLTYLVFGKLLPPDAWMGIAALSGSWIGGTANLVAVAESVGTPANIMGPTIVVDTIVGYGWMAVLLAFSTRQHVWDRRINAHVEALEETNRRLGELHAHQRPIDTRSIAMILALGFAACVAAVNAGQALPTVGDPTIISHTTWAILIVVTGGLLLSLSPLRRLEEVGASRLGYVALYLLLTGIGAQADLRAIFDAPLYLAAGVFWIAVHATVLLMVARLLRAPLFFFATSSMANIGGAVSGPIVASVYQPAMAPVGLLMAVLGYILGTYVGLGCAWLLGQMALH
jgi:uncharacterized membrane protein